MTASNTSEKGKEFAGRYLIREGFEIIERDWHCKAGRVDLIAREGNTLVFVNVASRNHVEDGFPEESVTKSSRRRSETIAASYLAAEMPPSSQVRFDHISIMFTGEQQCFLKHHRDVYATDE